MPSNSESAWACFKISLAALALTALIGLGLFIAFGVWAFWPIAGAEDLAEVRTNAETLIIAIDRYSETTGHHPEKLEQLVPQYLDSIPRPMRGKDAEYWYYPRAAGTWDIAVFAGGPADLDSSRYFRFESTTRTWSFLP